jgi:p-hydroxybenzoate 3-monooxygenase
VGDRRTGATTVGIVGCGPAGLVLAHLLHGAGVPFIVVERHTEAEVAGYPKAGIIEYRTVDLLRSVGIAGTLVDFTVENGSCEFRTPNDSVLLDYAALTGGRPHYVFPQHELVAKLCGALVSAGGDIRFATTVIDVAQDDGGVDVISVDEGGIEDRIRCDVVVGCDGGRGVTSAAIEGARSREEELPVRWLAMIGMAPPLVGHTIYAAHPHGFAGHMRRGPTHTRYYLEVSVADTLADWPQARMRDELTRRLGLTRELDGVALLEPSLLDLRMRMIEPMQHRRVFIAGDAAHLITPAGGKGMNLAIQDAVELAAGIVDCFGPRGDTSRLRTYSQTRLPPIWRTQAFSAWMLRLLLARFDDGSTAGATSFGGGLREGWVTALRQDPLLARWFAHAYAGVDPPLS